MLVVENLTRQYGARRAVDGVSLSIERGSFVGVIGRSGAGKSTLLRMLNRLADPTGGRILYDGTDVTALRGGALRAWRARCAMIFQQFNLVGRLDVMTNVLMGRLNQVPAHRSLLKLWSEQDRALAERILKPQEEGTEVAVRLRMRDAETCIWRGVWLEDGLRAAGVVALETKFTGSHRDQLTGLLDRRTFLVRAAETLTQPGEYELVCADVDRLRRLNEALGHERADLVLSALGSRLNAAFPHDSAAARVGELVARTRFVGAAT